MLREKGTLWGCGRATQRGGQIFFRLCLMFLSFKVAQKRLPKPTFRLGNLCVKGAFTASYMYLFISILHLAVGKVLSENLPISLKMKLLFFLNFRGERGVNLYD